MLFFIKSILSALFLPQTLFVILFGLSLVLIIRKKRSGRMLLVFTLLLFYVLSIRPVSAPLLRKLENRFPPLLDIPETITHVVVIGGGTRNRMADLSPANRLAPSTLFRFLEAWQYFKMRENGYLVLSGSDRRGRKHEVPEAEIMRDLARQLGVPDERIILDTRSRDTHEQALNLQGVLGLKPFLLVTSAFHMPRAMYIFRKMGMKPVAAPADFRAQGKKGITLSDFLPQPGYMTNSILAVREYLGLLFYRLL